MQVKMKMRRIAVVHVASSEMKSTQANMRGN
jgi:hypothetical protein